MASSKQSNAPTPNGGVRSEVRFMTEDNKPCDETVAKKALILEYDAQDNVIARNYMVKDN